jgi:hypothetical protein
MDPMSSGEWRSDARFDDLGHGKLFLIRYGNAVYSAGRYFVKGSRMRGLRLLPGKPLVWRTYSPCPMKAVRSARHMTLETMVAER